MLSMSPYFAALDLGSNSFHLLVVKTTQNGIQEIDKVKHMVRLGEGLDEDNALSEKAMQRGLNALSQMWQLMDNIPNEHIRVVATNTLRIAKNSADFVARAEATLGHEIEIISGTEEARLIYLGITAHNHFKDHNLVIDVGGGSTEIIVGTNTQADVLRSLKIGCANMAQRFFAKGRISKSGVKKALNHVGKTIEPHITSYTNTAWQRVILSSGTAKSVLKVLQRKDANLNRINIKQLNNLLDQLVEIGHYKYLSDQLDIDEARAFGFTGGVCILAGLFQHLQIDEAIVSQEALREGVLLDLMGRSDGQTDEREYTIRALQQRFNIDIAHANRVSELAEHLNNQLPLKAPPRLVPMLYFAAQVHEIGLAVALSKQQQHGAYLISNADLPGFSRLMQNMMALLIKGQRKKLPYKPIMALSKPADTLTLQYCLALRLAALIYRARRNISHDQYPSLDQQGSTFTLTFPKDYLATHPLTHADLVEEQEYWANCGGKLTLHFKEHDEETKKSI
ncbi:Ppx/GppA family phosphatase [Suttonella sp. R2A3]|uniref:Ppx/GppA phosphatase family protein n=1 Tax=Suttonella sp. R2A3 TaxID=2908648 RepID=UPI001F233CAD|nr:Ppx/GppA phosphatase family protein [Suttonella sp. R2A3]UJF23830.1 Ppx/GppA family phosphatase [Suttonella sp. R2A3]